jgi:hypothetical protein
LVSSAGALTNKKHSLLFLALFMGLFGAPDRVNLIYTVII